MFNEVLDIFPLLSYRLTFIMLNVGITQNFGRQFLNSDVQNKCSSSGFQADMAEPCYRFSCFFFFFFTLIRAFCVFLFKVRLLIVLWIFTFKISPLLLCQICTDKIKDHIKRKQIQTALFLKFTKKSERIYFLLDSPHVHPQLKKEIKERRQISTVNDVLNTDNLVPCRHDSRQRVHQKSMCAGNTKQEKLLNLNYFLFLLW